MLRLQKQIQQVDIDSGPGPFTRIQLGPPGSDHGFVVSLVGTPGPGLFDRFVTFVNPNPASGFDAEEWGVGDWGSLLEASVVPHGDGWTLVLEWVGRFGVTRIVWESPEVTVQRGNPIAEDPPEDRDRVRTVRKEVKSALAGWDPTSAIREVDFRDLPEFPPTVSARKLFGISPDFEGYSCVLHLDATMRTIIVLELVARYARCRWRFEPCEHATYSRLYHIMTQCVLPGSEITTVVPVGSQTWASFSEH